MIVVLLRCVHVHACAANAWHASRLEATCKSLITPFDAVQDACASATMATTSETMLNSTHAFKAVVVERGVEPLWDCFEAKKITTWSAMGLVLGFSPHESSDSLSQKWVEQVLLPLCRLKAGDSENERCITVRRLHLDAWTLVHSEAKSQRQRGRQPHWAQRTEGPGGPSSTSITKM